MVVQGQDKSSVQQMKVEVLQGLILGPLLFIIAVNDLASNVPCSTGLYADANTQLNSNKKLGRPSIKSCIGMV